MWLQIMHPSTRPQSKNLSPSLLPGSICAVQLALVMFACLARFDAQFGITSFLRLVRAWFSAGGSTRRRSWLTGYALSFSKIDFADTRWGSVVRAIKYLMEIQTKKELSKARKLLQREAKYGDKSAADALEEDDAPQLRWYALFEAVETWVHDTASDLDAAGAKERILTYMCSFASYAAFRLLSTVLATVPGPFTLLQGGAQWRPDPDAAATKVATSAVAIRQLLLQFKRLHQLSLRETLRADVRDQLAAFQAEALKRSDAYHRGRTRGPACRGSPAWRGGR